MSDSEPRIEGNPRVSANGFYCRDCRRFVYLGYDYRDIIEFKLGDAVCIKCVKHYCFKKEVQK